jgi:hypothetical protein
MNRKGMTVLLGLGTAATLTAAVWVGATRLDHRNAPPRAAVAEDSVAAVATLPAPGPSGSPSGRVSGEKLGLLPKGPGRQPAPRPNPHAAAAPFVQRFAGQPGIGPLPPRSSPTAKVRVPATIDGCDRNYGEKTQCVPLKFPPDVTDKCDWLTAHGFQHVRVVHTDSQRLDDDHDGVACND